MGINTFSCLPPARGEDVEGDRDLVYVDVPSTYFHVVRSSGCFTHFLLIRLADFQMRLV